MDTETFYDDDDRICDESCPACGWDYDGRICTLCGYDEDNGACPDCGTYAGFDGVVCERCFYHVPAQTDERWIDRAKWWVRDLFSTLRGFRQRTANRMGPYDDLPF